MVDFLKGRDAGLHRTGLNLVDVRDVAEGHLLACERGSIGERYILGCENLTLAQISENWPGSRAAGRLRSACRTRLPMLAGVASTGWARLSGQPPACRWTRVRMARKKMFVSHDKARRELGFEPGPVERRIAAGGRLV